MFRTNRSIRLVPLLAVALAIATYGVPQVLASHERPPRPVVKNHLDRTKAERGSYCWAQGDSGQCADYAFPPLPTDRTVRFHPGERVRVNLRYPARILHVERRNGDNLHEHPVPDTNRRRWRFEVPSDIDHSMGIYLFARYDKGDGVFGVRLKLHEH